MKKSFICANDIINKAMEENRYLPQTKLLKLLYFLYGHYYAMTDKVLFEEKFKAWQYGPVIPEVYNKTKKSDNINFFIKDSNTETFFVTNRTSDYGIEYSKVFDYVWEKYKHLSAAQLTHLTHSPKGPWSITRNNSGDLAEIDPELIRRYFKGEDISNG